MKLQIDSRALESSEADVLVLTQLSDSRGEKQKCYDEELVSATSILSLAVQVSSTSF